MHRLLVVLFILFSSGILFAQEDSVAINQEVEEVKIIQNFAWMYQRRLSAMRRVYPIALYAKKIVEEHQEKLDGVTKKRKIKKLGKQTHKTLKEEFEYNIRDLYTSEGALLIRLVHRETGMTVAEIIELFEGKTRRKWYGGLAKVGGHNIENRYDPEGKDYITEIIIEEIELGTISFSLAMKKVDKEEFKEGMKEYRSNRKSVHKQIKSSKKKK